jgi:hypothetical protein
MPKIVSKSIVCADAPKVDDNTQSEKIQEANLNVCKYLVLKNLLVNGFFKMTFFRLLFVWSAFFDSGCND